MNCRGEDAVGKKWIAMRRDCTKMRGIKKGILSLNLTGNSTDEDVHCMSSDEFNNEKQVNGHLYGIANNKKHMFDSTFE